MLQLNLDVPPQPAEAGVPAPELREVAQTWWDVDVVPVVVWDATGRAFTLVDPSDPARRLALLEVEEPAPDARELATVLAEGLAACDFPPTGERASPSRVLATLRTAKVFVTPTADWADDDAS